jgi:hypothetical protein
MGWVFGFRRFPILGMDGEEHQETAGNAGIIGNGDSLGWSDCRL